MMMLEKNNLEIAGVCMDCRTLKAHKVWLKDSK